MPTEYQIKIMKIANVEFNNIKNDDIIWFEEWDRGFGLRCIYHIYDKNGFLKDVKCGKAIPVSHRLFERPIKNKKKKSKIN